MRCMPGVWAVSSLRPSEGVLEGAVPWRCRDHSRTHVTAARPCLDRARSGRPECRSAGHAERHLAAGRTGCRLRCSAPTTAWAVSLEPGPRRGRQRRLARRDRPRRDRRARRRGAVDGRRRVRLRLLPARLGGRGSRAGGARAGRRPGGGAEGLASIYEGRGLSPGSPPGGRAALARRHPRGPRPRELGLADARRRGPGGPPGPRRPRSRPEPPPVLAPSRRARPASRSSSSWPSWRSAHARRHRRAPGGRADGPRRRCAWGCGAPRRWP